MADRFLFIIVILLMIIGMLFSYSLPVYLEHIKGWSEFYFLQKFIFFSSIGILIMIFLSQCNPDICISKIGMSIFWISLITIILMPNLLSDYVPNIKGAKRWLKLFGFTISPIEFFKIGIIYLFAWGFSRRLARIRFKSLKKEFKIVLPYLLILILIGLYILLFQNDLGEVLLIMMIFSVMLIFTQVQGKFYAILLTIGLAVFIFGLSQGDYRLERFKTALFNLSYILIPDSIRDLMGVDITSASNSYQIQQSINAIYNGGLFGKGIGNGEIKLGYLSDVHSDFVLAGIAEEIGFLGMSLVIILILALIWRLFRIANRLPIKSHIDYVHKLFVIGVAVLISLETILNSMGIIGLLPLKGLPLPYVSYGGSAIVAFSIAIGMVLMISKKTDIG